MPHTKINLLPEGTAVKARKNPVVMAFNRLGGYVLVVVYILTVAGLGYRWYYDAQLSDIRQSVEGKADQINRDLQFVGEYKELQNEYRVLGEALDIEIKKVEYLDFITATIPEPVSVTGIDISDTSLRIAARSTEYGAINQWYRAFESGIVASIENKYTAALNEKTFPVDIRSALLAKGYAVPTEGVEVTVVSPSQWNILFSGGEFTLKARQEMLDIILGKKIFGTVVLTNVERNTSSETSSGLVEFGIDILLTR